MALEELDPSTGIIADVEGPRVQGQPRSEGENAPPVQGLLSGHWRRLQRSGPIHTRANTRKEQMHCAIDVDLVCLHRTFLWEHSLFLSAPVPLSIPCKYPLEGPLICGTAGT